MAEVNTAGSFIVALLTLAAAFFGSAVLVGLWVRILIDVATL